MDTTVKGFHGRGWGVVDGAEVVVEDSLTTGDLQHVRDRRHSSTVMAPYKVADGWGIDSNDGSEVAVEGELVISDLTFHHLDRRCSRGGRR